MQGEMDDRFYILVSGGCVVERHGRSVGSLGTGDRGFGRGELRAGRETYRHHLRRRRRNRSEGLLHASLEQVSASCQLRFNRVFLSALIARLQSAERLPDSP